MDDLNLNVLKNIVRTYYTGGPGSVGRGRGTSGTGGGGRGGGACHGCKP